MHCRLSTAQRNSLAEAQLNSGVKSGTLIMSVIVLLMTVEDGTGNSKQDLACIAPCLGTPLWPIISLCPGQIESVPLFGMYNACAWSVSRASPVGKSSLRQA